MKFWCSVCNKPIEDGDVTAGDVIFVCKGYATEPVPDAHERLRAMHEECARKIGMAVKYPVYVHDDGTLEDE